jgi:DNA polymerase-3 subunit epsilon
MLSETNLLDGAFVAVDIETTGCTPGRSGIIEIGAARIEADRIVRTFSELARPGEPIPYAVQLLTGISDPMVARAPDIAQVFDRFRAFADGAVLVAHNYRFDLGFLDHLAETSLGKPFPRPVLDTLAIARKLRPDLGKYNLAKLAETYGVPTLPNHRADADARATAEIFLEMRDALVAEGLETAGDVARFCGMGGQQALARKLVLTTELPDCPGIYVLRNTRGRVVYVGRARNLKLRLRSYFYVNYEASGPRLGEETASMQFIPCPSELDSVLLQSRLVHRYHPKHNVSGQRGDFLGLVHIDTGSRFPAVRVTSRLHKTGFTVGPFVSRWALEALVEQLREVYGLRRCAARLTKRACEASCEFRDRGECPSPCVGKIDPGEYQVRVAEAMSVFDTSADGLRAELLQRQEKAANQHDRDGAIRYRDAARALERALSGLQVVREAAGRFGCVIAEPSEEYLALHFVRYGYLVKTLRVRREDAAADDWAARLRRSVHTAYFAGPYADNPLEFTPQQLNDVFLISAYRHQHSPVELVIPSDENAAVAALNGLLRRHLRVPRKRHAATSAAAGSQRP